MFLSLLFAPGIIVGDETDCLPLRSGCWFVFVLVVSHVTVWVVDIGKEWWWHAPIGPER